MKACVNDIDYCCHIFVLVNINGEKILKMKYTFIQAMNGVLLLLLLLLKNDAYFTC